jgi:hypothetical protein
VNATPIHRSVHWGDKGPDVRAWGRAMRAYLKDHHKPAANRATGRFGKGMQLDVQRVRELAKLEPGHVIGPRMQATLMPYVDRWGKTLLKMPIVKPPTEEQRNAAKFAGFCRWFVANPGRSRYAMIRPIPHPRDVAAGEILRTDCSGSGILGHEVAGTPDPNGTSYNGSGSTYSLEPRGIPIYPGQARTADAQFYQGHVAWFLGEHADYPGQVFTFGHWPPMLTGYAYRSDRTSTRRFPLV